ncbi:MAG: hypothetical protein ACMUJM_11965 [bacterium]
MVEIKKYSSKRQKDIYKVTLFLLDDIKIIGNIHIPVGARLTDYLNQGNVATKGESFLPLTEACIYKRSEGSEDTLLTHTPFICINKDHISFIFPLDP